MSRQLSNSFYGNNFIPGQQSISQQPRLIHPTQYHLEQTERRKQTLASDSCSPPTPAGSFSNGIDPGMLQYYGHIKQESNSFDAQPELDYPTLSPASGSPFGSPSAYDDISRSYKPSSYLESIGGSPGPEANNDYCLSAEFSPMSAPTSIPMDVKPNRVHRQPHNSYGNQISMSLPAPLNSWPYGTSVEQIQSGSIPFTSTGEMQMMPSFMDGDVMDDQKQQMLSEKKKRRRESHNAVERRRRDNINDRITELSNLLPSVYIDSTNKPNKGTILSKSVEYIRSLQEMLQENRRLLEEHRLRNSELEARVNNVSNVNDDEQG